MLRGRGCGKAKCQEEGRGGGGVGNMPTVALNIYNAFMVKANTTKL